MRILPPSSASPKELAVIFKKIRTAVERSKRNDYTAEVNIQIIKWGPELAGLRAHEFIHGTGLPPGYATEFSKMLKVSRRLVAAGFDLKKL